MSNKSKTSHMVPSFNRVWLFHRVGETILLGAHDVKNCEESEGCVQVNITEVWSHELHRVGGRFTNDIAVVK